MSSQLASRVGAQRPQLSHLPPDEHSTIAEEAIDLAASVGLVLDDWQQWVLRHALAERRDGKWSAFEVALVVPRQNGKGAVLEALELAAMFLLNERLILHSAHEVPTAMEHFLRLQALIEGSDDLSRKVAAITVANGKEGIRLKSGSRLKIKARSKGGGRGFSGDRIVLDEAYDLPPKAIGAMLPTLSARPNPQVWYTSSAPHADSVILHSLRQRAEAGDGGRLFYAEWCNEAGATDPADVDAWYRANPALGIRITEEFVADEYRSMLAVPEEFARERLGIPEALDGGPAALPIETWVDLVDTSSSIVSALAIGLDISPDRSHATFGAAGRRHDNLFHVETIDRRPGTGWVVDRAHDLALKYQVPIIIDPASPAGALKGQLLERGIDVTEVTVRHLVQACGMFEDAVTNRTVRHMGQRSLHDAVAGASRRRIGDAWAWNRTSSQVDITPLVACSLALGAVPSASSPIFAY